MGRNLRYIPYAGCTLILGGDGGATAPTKNKSRTSMQDGEVGSSLKVLNFHTSGKCSLRVLANVGQ